MGKTLFLDRDGVINDNSRKHVNKPQDLVIYKEAKEGLKKAYNAGYDLFVVTNQGGIELGHVTDEAMDAIHRKMEEVLKDICTFKAIKYCPDFKRASTCRKPKPGMILELADQYHIDLKDSWMIGDRDTDIEAGKKAGCKTAKIGQSYKGAEVNGEHLLDVVEKILSFDGELQ